MGAPPAVNGSRIHCSISTATRHLANTRRLPQLGLGLSERFRQEKADPLSIDKRRRYLFVLCDGIDMSLVCDSPEQIWLRIENGTPNT